MKIKNLITELSLFNPEADITTPYSEDICISWICKDPQTKEELTKKTTMQAFIEATDNCPTCASEYMNGDIRWCSFYDKPCRMVGECFQYEEFYE